MVRHTNSSRDLLPLAVLALLSERPRHPYELQRVMRERRMEFAAGRTRAVYATVEALAAEGLVEAAETNREGHRPERTIYRITDDGREELVDWLGALLEVPAHDQPVFGGAMALLCYLSADRALEALSGRLVALEADAMALDLTIGRLREQLRLPGAVLLDHEYRLVLLRAEVEWLRSLVSRILADGLPGIEELRAHFEGSLVAARAAAELRPDVGSAASNGTGSARSGIDGKGQ